MNRFRVVEHVVSSTAGSSGVAEAQGGSVHFFSPAGYTPQYEYPLFVWLHQHGGCPAELNRVIPHLSLQNYVGVGVDLRGLPAFDAGALTPSLVAQADQQVLAAVELASKRFSIHPRRIFLAGYREGGTLALQVALRYPERFAGGVSLGGAFPASGRVLANLQRARQLPLYFATYEHCRCWPVEAVCETLRLLNAARMRAEVRQYPGEDDLCTQMLDDLNRWLMSIVTQVPAEEPVHSLPFSAN